MQTIDRLLLSLLIAAIAIWMYLCKDARSATDIADMAERWVGKNEAQVVQAVCEEVGAEYHIDPWLIACVWRYENGFHKYSKSKYVGGLQLAKSHLRHFEEHGLDKTNWKDHIRYGVLLWSKQDTLSKALRPWGVRSKAIRLYKSIRGTTKGWNTYEKN